MSIIDIEGRPVAHGWKDDAATERCQRDQSLKLISDEDFEYLFPELFKNRQRLVKR